MSGLDWIKELVHAEQQMEEAGVVDMTAGFDPRRQMEEATLDFLVDLKLAFVEVTSAFNQMKTSGLGHIKIYGISKTKADFMLFRNGYKLIFNMSKPGEIRIFQTATNPQFYFQNPGEESTVDAQVLTASFGAFGQMSWSYNGQPIKLDYLVRYYVSRFVKDSAK
jgi:hypothetical protein